MTNVQEITEATAVVEDTSDIEAGSEPGRAFSSHTDRHYVAESIYAAAQLEQYGEQDADGRWVPSTELAFNDLAVAMADRSGRASDDVLFKLQQKVIDHRFLKMNRDPRKKDMSQIIGSPVSLDISPETPGRPQDLGHPSAPQVIFMEIDPQSQLYRAEDRRAMAVWFQPEVDDLGFAVAPRQGRNGRWYCDDTFHAGYHGIVDWFPSYQLAADAEKELRQAVRLLATPVEADVPEDERLNDLYDEAPEDAEKRRAAKQARSSLAF